MDFANFRSKQEVLSERLLDLNESLDTPQEFWLTDDTKIPKRVAGAFHYDGTDYGFIIVETNFNRVYEMRFHRFGSTGKPRRWAFKKASHIRPCLSTFFKFAETVIPLLKSKMDGIMIPIPGKIASQKFNRLAERIVKKSYIGTFRHVPVISPEGAQSYNHIFILRKEKTPASVFSAKAFKIYEFPGQPPNTVSSEALEKVEQKGVVKQKLTMEPSSKYQVKGFSVKYNKEIADKQPEIFKQAISGKSKLKSYKNPQVNFFENGKIPEDDDPTKPEPKKNTVVKKPNWLDNDLMALLLFSMVAKNSQDIMLEKGFDESKFNADNLKYQINKATSASNAALRSAMLMQWKDAEFITGNWENQAWDWTNSGIQKAKQLLYRAIELKKNNKDYMPPQDLVMKYMDALQDWQKYENDLKAAMGQEEISKKDTSYVKATYIDENTDWSALSSPISGAGEYTFAKMDNFYGMEKKENQYDKESYIQTTLGYKSLTDKGLSWSQKIVVEDYTGALAYDMNGAIRKYLGEEIGNKGKSGSGSPMDLKRVHILYSAFQAIDPLPEPIWVSRGATLPSWFDEADIMPGNFYVDPAFLSTSIYSGMTFGMGNLKLRIYLPAGSKVIPAMGSNSQNSGEREIILPASSALKIIRTDKLERAYSSGHVWHLTCIYTGSVFEEVWNNFVEKQDPDSDIGKKVKPVKTIEEQKKMKDDNKYDPQKKFSGSPDKALSKAVKKSVRTGKFKPKQPGK